MNKVIIVIAMFFTVIVMSIYTGLVLKMIDKSPRKALFLLLLWGGGLFVLATGIAILLKNP